MQLEGLHHVTAITGDASLNVAFYTQVLGLHLVKKTVNQDDVSAYHLFYGDETGSPGTELTFFDWPMAGPQRPGAGTISAIAFGVNGRAALEWWVQRFDSFKVSHEGIQTRGDAGKAVLAFRDPEGQRLELVDDEGRMNNHPWKASPVPASMAIHGLYAVRITAKALDHTAMLLTETLGFRQSGTYQSEQHSTVYVFEMGTGGPGTEIHLDVRPDLPFGRPTRSTSANQEECFSRSLPTAPVSRQTKTRSTWASAWPFHLSWSHTGKRSRRTCDPLSPFNLLL